MDTPTEKQPAGSMEMQEGDDFTCPNCACEVRVRHPGDPAKMQQMATFTCCCGTRMEKEQRPV